MRKILIYIALLLPLAAGAQSQILSRQVNRVRLSALRQLSYKYDLHSCSSSGLLVVDADNRYGIVNLAGQVILPLGFDSISETESGLYMLHKDSHVGFADPAGRIVAPCVYKDYSALCGRYGVVLLDDGQRGVVDSNGIMLFRGPYSTVSCFGTDVFKVTTLTPSATEKPIEGFVDIYGQTSFTQLQLDTIKRWFALNDSSLGVSDGLSNPLTSELESAETESDETIFLFVEQLPTPQGGDKALGEYLSKNLDYPAEAVDKNIEGVVYVRFIVEKDGTISNVRLVHDIGGGCGRAAVEAVENMPPWSPGLKNGKPVRVEFTLPILFENNNPQQ